MAVTEGLYYHNNTREINGGKKKWGRWKGKSLSLWNYIMKHHNLKTNGFSQLLHSQAKWGKGTLVTGHGSRVRVQVQSLHSPTVPLEWELRWVVNVTPWWGVSLVSHVPLFDSCQLLASMSPPAQRSVLSMPCISGGPESANTQTSWHWLDPVPEEQVALISLFTSDVWHKGLEREKAGLFSNNLFMHILIF